MGIKMKLLFVLLVFSIRILGCTTFIISGNVTKDGKPILFKHRDTGNPNNALRYFSDGKYSFTATVTADETKNEMVWSGFNSQGFAIMNSAAYTNNIGDTTKIVDMEGVLMKKALAECRTLEDFEMLLNNMIKPLGVDANFGVIDAYGGAAYYETGNFKWVKIDVNDKKVAPHGFLIRTNHSFSGKIEEGFGFIRYQTAYNELTNLALQNNLTPEALFNATSRNLKHSRTGIDLRKIALNKDLTSENFFFIDFIPRFSTASVSMVVGAKNPESINETKMWTIMGFPLSCVVYPVFLSDEGIIPELLALNSDEKSTLCSASLKLKESLFPITIGSGDNYINLANLYNNNESGILQKIERMDKLIFKRVNEFLNSTHEKYLSNEKLLRLYEEINKIIKNGFKEDFNIELMNLN